MARLFGTDGVRGVANEDLTPDLALALGRAAGEVLAAAGATVVVGRDTRVSGPMLEGALVAGLCSAGAHVELAGVIPTPAVAFLTLERGAAAGAVISASHNPVPDNGIKFFSDLGVKIGDETEAAIERHLEHPPASRPTGTDVGGVAVLYDAPERYTRHLIGALDGSLDGLKVVLDCAFGAASVVAEDVFGRAGARVTMLNDDQDGTRINVDSGSTSLDHLQSEVRKRRADLGIAFDGDADRALAVDETGAVVDGDQIIGLLALSMAKAGHLQNNVIVSTVMANLGLVRTLREEGIEVVRAPVGDRFVAAEMVARGAVLGGEQSGHLIFGAHSTTGDGILTGLKLAEAMRTSGEPLSKLADVFESWPQRLINVPVRDRNELESCEPLWELVRSADLALGDAGRILLRASGTEPVVRVMVEAEDEGVADITADHLADAVRLHLG
ncbi:MAG TPA: phosphoglucosamine mutase [Actinomycetota bacterium]|nr:phosphoglucosamine mutase [Actinomycetota bacterium]